MEGEEGRRGRGKGRWKTAGERGAGETGVARGMDGASSVGRREEESEKREKGAQGGFCEAKRVGNEK